MGGCASKPKVDSNTRKVPGPALRKPHAPPEIPVDSPKAAAEPVAQEKKDGDETKKTSLIDVSETAPKTKEAEITEEKPTAVPVEVNPVEAKVETYELPKEEQKELAETVVPTEEQKEVTDPVVPKEEKKEVVETVVPKEDKKEVGETVVPKEEKKEIAETVVPKEEKKEIAETVAPKEEKKDIAEPVVSKEEKKEIAETVVPTTNGGEKSGSSIML